MAEIEVKGLGRVRVKGDAPDEEEQQAIIQALRGQHPEVPEGSGNTGNLSDPGVPSPTEAPQRTPTITRLTGGLVTRPGAVMVGGTLGGVAGGVATIPGGAAIGVIGGGAVGAGLGSLAFDLADEVAEIFTGDEPPDRGGAFGPSKKALEEAGEDLLFSGGIVGLGPVFRSIKPAVGRMLGIGDDAARLVARPGGQALTPIQVTKSKAVKGIARVVGVFPFMNKPLHTSAAKTGAAVSDQFDDILDTLAPNATISDLGVDLTKAARGRFVKFRRVAGALYKRFDDLASAASTKEIIPTGDMRIAAGAINQADDAGRIALKGGGQLKSPIADPTSDFIRQLDDLPNAITITQARQLQRDLNEAMTKSASDGFDISRLLGIKKGLEAGINSPRVDLLPQKEADKIVRALRRANGFYAEAIKPFKTTTAGRFGRVDRNIFRSKAFKAGSINEDEVFNAVLNARSPEAISDLRRLVGPKKMGDVSRKFLVNAWNASAGGGGKGAAVDLDLDGFARRVGLDDDSGKSALKEMLAGSGVGVKDLENLIDVAKAGNSVTVPDSSVFIQRRITLGGIRSLLGGLGMGASLVANPISTATGILMVRRGVQILSDPAQLKLMIKAADDTVPQMLRRSMLLRVAEAVLDDNATEEPSEPVPQAQAQRRHRRAPQAQPAL